MITIDPSTIDLELTKQEWPIVHKELSFTNKAAQQLYNRFRKNRWYLTKHGEEAFYDECEKLKSQIQQNLLSDEGTTYSGLAYRLEKLLGRKLKSTIVYPKPQALPWASKPQKLMRYYQEDSLEKLLEAKHAGVEIGTGLGKSFIIVNLIKQLGLQTMVMAPSMSIADQLFDELVIYFGTKRVGKCYDGKKDTKKLITIALPQTLTKLKPKDPIYKKLAQTQVFIADESHLCPAKTLADVCMSLVKNAPYRFFFSATQMRNDGKDLMLEGITGPIVYQMTVREGVDKGFLAKPVFKMVKTYTDRSTTKTDPNDLTRINLYYNTNVIKQVAMLANNFHKHLNHQVLILIDEVEQFTKVLPYLEYQTGFAHGPLSDNKSKVPEAYWESDPNELVKKFNNNEIPILIGTSCITTGTDIRNVRTLIYWRGGKSEVEVKQCVGRGTRKVDDKNYCNVIDFDVVDCDTCHRHANDRREFYNDIYGPVEEL